MIMKQFFAMVKARTMEFVRDRGTFIWNLIFPIVLVVGISVAVGNQDQFIFKAGIIGATQAESPFKAKTGFQYVEYTNEHGAKARDLLRKHKLDLLIDVPNKRYLINPLSPKGRFLIESFSGQLDSSQLTREEISGEPIRYVDELIPGIIGMNLMFSCLWGVGYVLVRYRKNGVLKRMKATPVSALNFITAQAFSRIIIVIVTAIVIFSLTVLIVGSPVKGSWVDLLIVLIAGIFAMVSMGLLFASRFKSEELAGGVLNLIGFPMIIMSGVFVSLEGAPEVVQGISKAFPLTHLIDGARAIMLDGANLLVVLPSILFLLGFTVVFLLLSALFFKWE